MVNKQEDTATQIMEVAQKLMQERGYNAFSYADISEQVGIRKATIHYYFPAKSDLARETLVRYRTRIRGLLKQVNQQVTEPKAKLERLVQGYSGVLHEQNLICLCGMLGAEMPTLPEEVRREVLGFFREVEDWIVQILDQGIKQGVLQVTQPLEVEAHLFLAAIQGAMLVARAFNEPNRFDEACARLIAHLVSS